MMRLSRDLTPDQFEALLTEFQTLLREVFEPAALDVETSGDTVTAAFASAKEAVLAGAAAQRAVSAHAWPGGLTIAISVGLDSDPLRCAELCDTAEGGQIFLSPTTARLLRDEDLGELVLRDLGELRTRRGQVAVHAYELRD